LGPIVAVVCGGQRLDVVCSGRRLDVVCGGVRWRFTPKLSFAFQVNSMVKALKMICEHIACLIQVLNLMFKYSDKCAQALLD